MRASVTGERNGTNLPSEEGEDFNPEPMKMSNFRRKDGHGDAEERVTAWREDEEEDGRGGGRRGRR